MGRLILFRGGIVFLRGELADQVLKMRVRASFRGQRSEFRPLWRTPSWDIFSRSLREVFFANISLLDVILRRSREV